MFSNLQLGSSHVTRVSRRWYLLNMESQAGNAGLPSCTAATNDSCLIWALIRKKKHSGHLAFANNAKGNRKRFPSPLCPTQASPSLESEPEPSAPPLFFDCCCCCCVSGSYRACVLAEVARQAATAILDGKVSSVLHVCTGLGRVVLVVKHCEGKWQ